jgi:hypothetical protein
LTVIVSLADAGGLFVMRGIRGLDIFDAGPAFFDYNTRYFDTR